MGASWMNTVLGIIVLVSDVGAFITKFASENAVPISISDWFMWGMGLATGVGLIVSKQWNVSNSQHPAAPTVVPPTLASTPNPAAKL